MNKTFASFLTGGALLVSTNTTHASLLLHDPFSVPTGTYDTGLLPAPNANGLNNLSTLPITITSGSLTNPMALPGSGNRYAGSATGFMLGTNFTRDIPAGTNIWGSFLVQNAGPTNFPSGWEMSVNTTTASNQNIGVYFYPFFAGVNVNGIFNTAAVTFLTDAAQLFLFRVDQDSFDLWVNPLSTNLGAPAYTTTMSPITRINSLRFNVSGVNDLDEVRLGTTQFDVMLPSPSAAALLGLGGLLAARRRR